MTIFFKIGSKKSISMQRIGSLTELLDVLPHCSGQEYVDLAANMNIPVEDFEPYAHWFSDSYTRNCIDRTKAYELILLCWEPGQITPIHCHAGEECWVYTLQGPLDEERFDIDDETCKLKQTGEEYMKDGQISYMNDNMGFHRLINNDHKRSMTLHLYMNPIDRCRVYDEDKREFVESDLEYDTFKGKPVAEGASVE